MNDVKMIIVKILHWNSSKTCNCEYKNIYRFSDFFGYPYRYGEHKLHVIPYNYRKISTKYRYGWNSLKQQLFFLPKNY